MPRPLSGATLAASDSPHSTMNFTRSLSVGSAALLIAVGLSATLAQAQPAKGPKKKDDAPPGYKKDNLRGFTLYFSDEVLKQDRDSKLERQPLEALERELIIVENV